MTTDTGKIKEVVLLLDAGGTHTRARLIAAGENMLREPSVVRESSAVISDKHALLDFIRAMRADYTVTAAVFSFAGPVFSDAVAMTNWRNRDEIRLSDLSSLGLPAGRTMFINDMEAAALCLIAYKTGAINLKVEELYPVDDSGSMHFNNAVLIIPGTGVGIAGVILPGADGVTAGPIHVSCELQHTQLPDLGSGYSGLLAALRQKLNKARLTWEDLVSGQGLENIDRCLRVIGTDGREPGENLTAAEIASRAAEYSDKYCVEALACYYHVAGMLAQVLALAFQPFAGIYLGGETTRKNLAFIRNSSFVKRVQDNDVRKALLRSFPVYLIPEYMNLNGAMYLASRVAQ